MFERWTGSILILRTCFWDDSGSQRNSPRQKLKLIRSAICNTVGRPTRVQRPFPRALFFPCRARLVVVFVYGAGFAFPLSLASHSILYSPPVFLLISHCKYWSARALRFRPSEEEAKLFFDEREKNWIWFLMIFLLLVSQTVGWCLLPFWHTKRSVNYHR